MTISWLIVPVSFWPDAVDEQAVDDAQHRAGQRRHRDHQALLGRVSPSSAAMIGASGPSMTQTMNETSK